MYQYQLALLMLGNNPTASQKIDLQKIIFIFVSNNQRVK